MSEAERDREVRIAIARSIKTRGKIDPDWRRFTNEEAEAIFDELALESTFWRLS